MDILELITKNWIVFPFLISGFFNIILWFSKGQTRHIELQSKIHLLQAKMVDSIQGDSNDRAKSLKEHISELLNEVKELKKIVLEQKAIIKDQLKMMADQSKIISAQLKEIENLKLKPENK